MSDLNKDTMKDKLLSSLNEISNLIDLIEKFDLWDNQDVLDWQDKLNEYSIKYRKDDKGRR